MLSAACAPSARVIQHELLQMAIFNGTVDQHRLKEVQQSHYSFFDNYLLISLRYNGG